MKKAAFILMAGALFFACTNTEKEKSPETDSIRAVLSEKDSALSAYLASFADIEHILDSINSRQQNILLKTGSGSDLKGTVVEEINMDISGINTLIADNSKKISLLNERLRDADNKNKKLEDAIKTLNGQLSAKKQELTDLNDQLSGLSSRFWQLKVTVDLLELQNAIQAGIISRDTKDLHRAYYVTGTAAELEKAKIIDKKGGLLGIGKSAVLSNDVDPASFTKIDVTETLSIPLHCKSAQLVTSHPDGSYKLEQDKGNVQSLLITDTDKFWSLSKYLVIAKK